MLLALREKDSVTLRPLSAVSASVQDGARVVPGAWSSTQFSPDGAYLLLLSAERAVLRRVAADGGGAGDAAGAAPAEGAAPAGDGAEVVLWAPAASGAAGEGLLAAAFSPRGTYVQVLRKARGGDDEPNLRVYACGGCAGRASGSRGPCSVRCQAGCLRRGAASISTVGSPGPSGG